MLIVVYDLKFVGPLEFELVAPMPEQLKTKPPCISLTLCLWANKPQFCDPSFIVVVPVCSGMGATKLKFRVLMIDQIVDY